jgi:hypothetical protein
MILANYLVFNFMVDYAIKKERESGGVGTYMITSVIRAH